MLVRLLQIGHILSYNTWLTDCPFHIWFCFLSSLLIGTCILYLTHIVVTSRFPDPLEAIPCTAHGFFGFFIFILTIIKFLYFPDYSHCYHPSAFATHLPGWTDLGVAALLAVTLICLIAAMNQKS